MLRAVALGAAGSIAITVIFSGLCSRLMSVAVLGEFLLARRIVGWLTSATQIPTGLALPYYMAARADSPRAVSSYFVSAGGISVAISVAICLALVVGPARIDRLLFGPALYAVLALPVAVWLIGNTLNIMAFGYYRGTLAIHAAVLIQFLGASLIPLIALLALAHFQSAKILISAIALAVVLVSAAFLLPAAIRSVASGFEHLQARSREVLAYGFPRMPGDFGLQAIMTLGPVVALHWAPMSEVTALLLGGSILTGITSMAAPVGTILLPKVAFMLAGGQREAVRRGIEDLSSVVIAVSVFVAAQVAVLSTTLVRVWLGPAAQVPIVPIVLVVLGTPFYAFYVAVRNAVDGAAVRAYNTRNILIALAVFLVLTAGVAGSGHRAWLAAEIACTWSAALVVLAVLTASTLRGLTGATIPWRQMVIPLLSALGLAAISAVAERRFGASMGLATLAVLELAMVAAFGLVAHVTGARWLRRMIVLAR